MFVSWLQSPAPTKWTISTALRMTSALCNSPSTERAMRSTSAPSMRIGYARSWRGSSRSASKQRRRSRGRQNAGRNPLSPRVTRPRPFATGHSRTVTRYLGVGVSPGRSRKRSTQHTDYNSNQLTLDLGLVGALGRIRHDVTGTGRIRSDIHDAGKLGFTVNSSRSPDRLLSAVFDLSL